MKRNIFLVLLMTFLCCICFSGCFFLQGNSNHSNTNLISNNSIEEDSAQKAAIQYIEDKYGFTPSVLGVELGDVYERGKKDAMVTMEYNGREFLVYIYNINLSLNPYNYCDSYQKTDIENAVADHAVDVFGIRPSQVNLYVYEVYPESFHAENMMFYYDQFYDGNNAFDLINEYNSFECVIRFVGDVDLVQIAETDDDFFHREGIDILYTSHATEADMNNCFAVRYDNIYYETFDDYVYNCALYMTGAVEYSHGSVSEGIYEHQLSIGQCGNFYYLCTNKDASEYTVSIAPDYLTADDINQADWDGYAMLKDIGTEAIYVDGEFDEDNIFYLYCPMDKLPVVPASLPNDVVTLEHAFTEIKYNNDRFCQLNELNDGRNDVGTYAVFNSELTGNKDNSFRFMFFENIWN